MFPLLSREGLTIPYFVLWLLYTIIFFYQNSLKGFKLQIVSNFYIILKTQIIYQINRL